MAHEGARRPYDPAAHVRSVLEESASVKRALAAEEAEPIARLAELLAEAFRCGNKLVRDGMHEQHIAAEWTGRLVRERAALPALALTANPAELTAVANDYGFDRVFARLIEAHGQEGDVAIAISTSGNSQNVLAGVDEARARGLHTVGLSGRGGGKLADRVDLALVVPSNETQRIQEAHLAVAHAVCEVVESLLFQEPAPA